MNRFLSGDCLDIFVQGSIQKISLKNISPKKGGRLFQKMDSVLLSDAYHFLERSIKSTQFVHVNLECNVKLFETRFIDGSQHQTPRS